MAIKIAIASFNLFFIFFPFLLEIFYPYTIYIRIFLRFVTFLVKKVQKKIAYCFLRRFLGVSMIETPKKRFKKQ
jgi:hypothetical protein